MNQMHKIKNIIEPQYVIEGAGVLLRRSIAPKPSNEFDPFLLFDHFAFNDPVEGPIRGFPMHPHRGIETVTYMLEGSVNHRDSLGNSGLIGAGDVQWMTSGSGIMHEEMPRRGPSGTIYGFQLWVNLPAALKMTRPRYQEVKATDIPIIQKEGAAVRVVAGDIWGVKGPVTEIAANPVYFEVNLEPRSEFVHPIPTGHTVMAYVFEGEGFFGASEAGRAKGEPVSAVKMVIFDDGETFQAKAAGTAALRFMLMAGAPFKEPIVPYGPFVMNTVEEIQQALVELRNGTFIRQDAALEPSKA
jgi:redox-sensitive bicupin YhaK (pirin superfamily)